MAVTYSLHKITNTQAFSFDPAAYSRFKFGDGAVAQQFGRALAEGFISEHLSGVAGNTGQMVVIPSPYSFIPTATFAMKDHFACTLNRWLAGNGQPVVQETKAYRTITYKDDYGALNAAERMQLIGNDSFHIDREFLHGKTLVFLDDIRITGSHERMIMKMVQQHELQNDIYLLYFAELANTEMHPNIENYLNYYQVSSVFDLEPIINSGHFLFNTRVVKYILNAPFDNFCVFIHNQGAGFINSLYDLALGNGYHTMSCYSNNLNYIKQHLLINDLKTIPHGN